MLMKEKATAVLDSENYVTHVTHRNHEYFTDEPMEVGGKDKYTTQQELLLGALASCVATTLRMYANRKGWGLGTSQKLLFGISFGYTDRDAPVNQCRTVRATVKDNIVFHG